MPIGPSADVETAHIDTAHINTADEQDPGGGVTPEPDGDDDLLVELAPDEAERFMADGGASDSQHDFFSGIDVPRIPGFVIEGLIGRGATGMVFRARQEAVDRPIALKVLHRELITNRRAVKRLKREARLAAQLAHPSIISAIDLGVQDGLWWYAMELVEGVSLARRIAERGSLTERECLRLFSPLCDALQHAHEVGVVHRDIKPANILLDRRGRARLVDLGLAVGQNDPSITKTGATLGTPHYVSPEQARDPGDADIRSDLWSLGATMYHAVCGRPPFQTGESSTSSSGGVAEILSRVLYMPIEDPRQLAPGLSKGFALLLRKCLTRDPAQRYQEPWELVADIETLRERRRLDLRGSQVDAFASRRPAWVGRAAAVGGVALAIAGTWALTAKPWSNQPEQSVVPARPSLADWPALRAIQQEFERGGLRHAGALTELDAAAAGLPDEARYFENELRTSIKRSLARQVDELVAERKGEHASLIEARDFDGALRVSGPHFAQMMLDCTGFHDADDLPVGSVRLAARDFQSESRIAVERAKSQAVSAAKKALEESYTEHLRRKLDTLLEEGRYDEALAWLGPVDSIEWIRRAGTEVDVTGLNSDEQFEVARAIEQRLQGDRGFVNSRASSAYSAAKAAAQQLEQKAAETIRDGLVTSPESVGASFAAAVSASNEAAGFDPAHLPADFRRVYEASVEGARQDIDREEARMRAKLARIDLVELARGARAAYASRDYDHVLLMYEAARQEDWRLSTFDEIDARLAEAKLLLEFRALACVGVADSDGTVTRLDFAGIGFSGRIVAEPGEVERIGFTFVVGAGSKRDRLSVLVWRPASEPRRGADRMLATEDVVGFAAAASARLNAAPDGAEPSQSGRDPARAKLRLAAFLAAEGELGDALGQLPIDAPPPGLAPLVWTLEQRIRERLDVERGSGGRRQKGRSVAGGTMTPGQLGAGTREAIEQKFGTPNQVTNGHRIRLAWNFIDGGEPDERVATDIVKTLPTGDRRFGTWRNGLWRRSFQGLVLDDPLPRRGMFFERGSGPSLDLGAPFDLSRGARVVLKFKPELATGLGELFVVSMQGYHVVICGSRAWFGLGDLRALTSYIDEGGRDSFEEFEARDVAELQPNEVHTLELALRIGKLDSLILDGRSLGFQRLRTPPARPDSVLKIRSREPMTLLSAELSGSRIPPK